MKTPAVATTLIALALAIMASSAAASTVHGFRDSHAPREAAAIANAHRDVEDMRCRWKVPGHLIGCEGHVRGLMAYMTLWSNGRHVIGRACMSGVCSPPARVGRDFGRPY